MDKKVVRPLIKNIAFFGDSDVPEDGEDYKDAYKAAKILGKKGYTIVNGGGPGIMNASTQGAEAGGGETLSVTFSPKDAPGFEGRYLGNVTDKEIKTENYIERMFKLMEHADVYVIFRGGSGTLSEFATAWVLAKLYFGHHKPFILYGAWWKEIIDAIDKNMLLDEQELSAFVIVDSKEEMLDAIEHFEHALLGKKHEECKVCSSHAFML